LIKDSGFCGGFEYQFVDSDYQEITDASLVEFTPLTADLPGSIRIPSQTKRMDQTFEFKLIVKLMADTDNIYPRLEYLIQILVGSCQVKAVTAPTIKDASYTLGSGPKQFQMSGSFSLHPPCPYEYSLSASFSDSSDLVGIVFDSETLTFSVDTSSIVGYKSIVVALVIDNEYQHFESEDAQWNIKFIAPSTSEY